jgi:hypothetical protein|tara:strand:+ start:486 stop:788 length:303 start_codon:yes stop_codon:yes gene_type:complete
MHRDWNHWGIVVTYWDEMTEEACKKAKDECRKLMWCIDQCDSTFTEIQELLVLKYQHGLHPGCVYLFDEFSFDEDSEYKKVLTHFWKCMKRRIVPIYMPF